MTDAAAPSTRLPRREALALLVLLGAQFAWLAVDDRARVFATSAAIVGIATAAWLVLAHGVVRARWRPSFALAFGVAVVLRLLAWPLEPGFSDDIYRYLFEGRLVLAGENPYLVAPADEAAAAYLDPIWGPRINNPEISAAYPPATQLALALGVLVDPGPWGQKAVFGAFDLAVFVLLWFWLRARGRAFAPRAIVHGWCPLVVLEFAGEGHSDSLAIAAMVAALFAAEARRPLVAGLLLAVGTAGKLLPVVLLPFVARASTRGWVCTAAFLGGVFALWAPFVPLDDPASMLRGTLEYADRWRSNDSAFALVWTATEWVAARGWLPDGVEVQRAAKVPILLLGCGLLATLWFRRVTAGGAALAFFAFFVAFTPTMHPWYVGFFVPFVAFAPRYGWLAFCGGTVFLAYHVLPGWLERGEWREVTWLKVASYAPFYAAFVPLGSSVSPAPAADPD